MIGRDLPVIVDDDALVEVAFAAGEFVGFAADDGSVSGDDGTLERAAPPHATASTPIDAPKKISRKIFSAARTVGAPFGHRHHRRVARADFLRVELQVGFAAHATQPFAIGLRLPNDFGRQTLGPMKRSNDGQCFSAKKKIDRWEQIFFARNRGEQNQGDVLLTRKPKALVR
jgi:hypothetical protein